MNDTVCDGRHTQAAMVRILAVEKNTAAPTLSRVVLPLPTRSLVSRPPTPMVSVAHSGRHLSRFLVCAACSQLESDPLFLSICHFLPQDHSRPRETLDSSRRAKQSTSYPQEPNFVCALRPTRQMERRLRLAPLRRLWYMWRTWTAGDSCLAPRPRLLRRIWLALA